MYMGTGELFSTYGAALLRCAKRVTGSDADAEEAVAETFLALVRHPAAVDPDREPWPYLRRAVLNRAFNQLRRRRRAPTPLPPDMTAPANINSRPTPARLARAFARMPGRRYLMASLRSGKS